MGDGETPRSSTTQDRWLGAAATSFLWLEHAAYAALGILLSFTALLALAAAAALLWTGLGDWTNGQTILLIIDRLLFVLMLIEILHTVRASMRSGGLTCEPFLVVGLIACIRRVLVITLHSSETTKQDTMSDAAEKLFQASMIELGVLAVLILVMITSIFLLHRSGAKVEG
jgi:uncharacterized membrane protein (DUF373 family)